jgi:hypothetical protein
MAFRPVHAAATSIACKSETEVVSMVFRPRSHRRHFPCIQQRVGCGFLWPFDPVRTAATQSMQQRVGGGLYGLSTPFALPPPPLHATASRSLSGS